MPEQKKSTQERLDAINHDVTVLFQDRDTTIAMTVCLPEAKGKAESECFLNICMQYPLGDSQIIIRGSEAIRKIMESCIETVLLASIVDHPEMKEFEANINKKKDSK